MGWPDPSAKSNFPHAEEETVIERIWHGWTNPEEADEYERLLHEKIFPSFADQHIDGYRGFRVLRRANRPDEEVEFVTIMRFDSLDAVREFAGEDHEQAHVPEEAQALLSRYDDRARHYEVRAQTEY